MRRFLAVLFLFVAPAVLAQSADQQILSITDSPDPVAPGNNVTYTIQVRNNGPDAATNGGINVNFPSVNYVSSSAPAGFTCFVSGNNLSCTNPSFASGVTATITLVMQMPAHLVSFPDGSTTLTVSTSGTTSDPNNANNSDTETTAWDSPQIDVAVTASDSPDPIGPSGDITYTATVTNAGPDAGTNAQFSMFNNGSLTFQSATVPAGWNCTLPAVNGTPTFTCTSPTIAVGANSQFTIVARAGTSLNDGSVASVFTANATGNDTVPGNNQETETTTYLAPDADVQLVSATDSPDPVAPDGNITYTVVVRNNGPDTPSNTTLNVPMNNTLRFVSVTAPAGWTCTPPAVGAGTSWSCTNPSFASGAQSTFTIVLSANDEQFGINDGTIQQVFSIVSNIADPVDNNTVIVSTAYVAPDSDIQVTATDSPDPVNPDGNITYTVTVTNAGPDAATNTVLNVPMNNTLRFVSTTTPAGWTCTPPAVGAGTSWSCTNPSLASGASSVFTIVLRANDEQFGINDQTIQQVFSANSGNADPNNANNLVNVSTQYVAPDSDIQITATDAPDPVTPDNNITYTVTVTNAGPDAATNTILNVPMNNTLRFVSTTTPAGWTCTPPAVGAGTSWSCTNPSLASGASSVFTIVLRANDEQFGITDQTIQQVFTANSGNADPNNANNLVNVATTYNAPTANLVVSNSDTPDPVAQGGTITYTQTLENAGPDAAPNTQFVTSTGAGTTFQSFSAPAGWSCTTPAVGATGTITCTIASFPNAGFAAFTLVTNVTASSGTISNTATGSANAGDPFGTNNSATTTTTVTATPQADLSISKTTTSNTLTQGQNVTYTIALTNAGPDAAPNPVMTDVLPAGLLFQSITAPAGFTCTTPAVGANGTITCTAATLANGANATFTLVVRVANNATGSISNTATASSGANDSNAGNSSSGTTPIVVTPASADLGVTKSTTATTVAPGQNITYTITATNAGPDAASNVVVTDTLPASLTFQSITAPAGFTCTTPAVNASGTITCTAATLASGANAAFTLVVRVANNATGTIANGATISSATSDPNGTNGTSITPPMAVVPLSADLSVAKTTTATSATPGGDITYTIAVTNNGPDAAAPVTMSDTLPASLLFQSIATPAGFTCTTPAIGASGTITCNGATLASGATATFALVVRVTNPASGTIVNTATVSSPVSDPNGGNSTSSTPPLAIVDPGADVGITKTTGSTAVPTGGSISYTITVTNAGPLTATSVVVTDTLPSSLVLISATPSQGTCSGTTTVTCNLGTLVNGANATITLAATVVGTSGNITNTATVSSAIEDPNPANNSGTSPSVPIGAPTEGAAQIPTLSEWALMFLAALLGLGAMLRMRS